MIKLSVPMRALFFAMSVAVVVPLGLWLIVQFYEWSCATLVTCEPMVKPSHIKGKIPEPPKRSYYPMENNP